MSHFTTQRPYKFEKLKRVVGFWLFLAIAIQSSVVFAQADKISESVSISPLRMGQIEAWNSTAEDLQLLDVSVVSEETIQKIFQEFLKESLTFNYPDDGCYARAHRMVLMLEEQGIVAVKSFVIPRDQKDGKTRRKMRVKTSNSPSGSTMWGFHVAPVLLVEVNGKEIPYIIDPSLFNKAVPYMVWLNLLKIDSDKDLDFSDYVTKRTIYHWSEIQEGDSTRDSKYDADFLMDMEAVLNSIEELQRVRQQEIFRKSELKN